MASPPLAVTQNDVATPNLPTIEGPCRDIKTLSRHPQGQTRSRPLIDVATSLCFPHRKAPVATQNLGHDAKPLQGIQNHVVTSNRCRDTTKANPGRDTKHLVPLATPKPHVAKPRGLLQSSQVVTSKLCRDLNLFSPCHDVKFMSRPRPTSPSLNHVVTSNCFLYLGPKISSRAHVQRCHARCCSPLHVG